MNYPSTVSMTLAKAVEGFIQAKVAEGVSENTITTYSQHLRLWVERHGGGEVGAVAAQDVRGFLAWLRSEYVPQRITGRRDPLSPKTIHNYWITLSSFYTWAQAEFGLPSPMKGVRRPDYEEPPVEPFTQDEVERLLQACDYCAMARTQERRRFAMRRPTGLRDRALILLLLDTGLRASELCALRVGDVDLKTGRVDVKHGAAGGAKGGKGRVVYLGKNSRAQLWRYLSKRSDVDDPQAPLFLGKFNRPMRNTTLRQVITTLGEKAGVKKSHPHRFRHTFAITYLRSGGDLFTLQALLGHASLEMVQHYARVALVDISQAHRRASPVDNWHL